MLTVRWRVGRGATDERVPSGDALRSLGSTAHAEEAAWLDAVGPDSEELAVIAALVGVSEGALTALLAAGRPAVLVHDERIAMLVPAVALDQHHDLHIDLLAVIVGTAWIVTYRRVARSAGAELADAVATRLAAAGTITTIDVLAVVLDEVVDQLWEVSDDLDDRLADAERASIEDAESAVETSQALRRDLLVLHRAVGPFRRILANLIDIAARQLTPAQVVAMRQTHDAVVGLREQLDAQLLLLNGLSQTQVLAASHRANEVMQATSSWGAILVVATLITGIYGMNFRAMPELAWPWGYPFALALIVGATLVLYRLFKSRGWL